LQQLAGQFEDNDAALRRDVLSWGGSRSSSACGGRRSSSIVNTVSVPRKGCFAGARRWSASAPGGLRGSDALQTGESRPAKCLERQEYRYVGHRGQATSCVRDFTFCIGTIAFFASWTFWKVSDILSSTLSRPQGETHEISACQGKACSQSSVKMVY